MKYHTGAVSCPTALCVPNRFEVLEHVLLFALKGTSLRLSAGTVISTGTITCSGTAISKHVQKEISKAILSTSAMPSYIPSICNEGAVLCNKGCHTFRLIPRSGVGPSPFACFEANAHPPSRVLYIHCPNETVQYGDETNVFSMHTAPTGRCNTGMKRLNSLYQHCPNETVQYGDEGNVFSMYTAPTGRCRTGIKRMYSLCTLPQPDGAEWGWNE